VSLLEMKGEYDLDPGAPAPAEMVRRFLETSRPGMVGVTFISSEFEEGVQILEEAKRFDPRIVTVAGGLHATLCPGDFAGRGVDVVITGQGAGAFAELARAVDEGRPIGSVPGINVIRDGQLRSTGRPARAIDSAGRDFVMPDRALVERVRSTYVVGRGIGPATYLFSSLGCPYKCSFCSIWPQYDGAYLTRSVDSIIEELRLCEGYPVVRFADANSVVDHGFMEALFDRMLAEGIRKTFIMDIRVDAAAANPALVEKMARCGLAVVISGFESFRNEELRRYNKSSQAELIREAVRIFHDNGVMIRGNYVVPTDYGPDDFDALAEYAGSQAVAYAGYTILTPMPGTPLFFEVRDRITDRELAKYNFFNAVLPTRLPLPEFYARVADLWAIRRGSDVI
jgi:radical SAM superfamily enzyme YgiQ (UPF0313 family)